MNCLFDPLCFDAALFYCLRSALSALELVASRVFGPEWTEVGDALRLLLEPLLADLESRSCTLSDGEAFPGA